MSTPPIPERTPSWHAHHTPDAPAIIMASSGEVTTYAQLEDRSIRLANALRDCGLSSTGHLALLMENNRPYLEVLWAAQRSELHYTAINSHLRPDEVQYVLDDCGATALVSSAAMADIVAGLDLAHVAVRICAAGELDGFERYEEVLAGAAAEPSAAEREGREMLYSSGTTGRPKGVRKPVSDTPFGDPESVPVQVAAGIAMLGAGPGAVYLSPAPLYHAAPLVYSMSVQRLGATVVLMERFDAVQCLELIEQHRVTMAQFVPTMFIRMLRLPEDQRAGYDVSSLQVVLHAAAPCPIVVKQQMIDWWGPILLEYYAGTEDVGTTIISSSEWLEHQGSVGRPVDECHIVGDDGEDLPPGEPGIVYFAGGRPFEYHNDPEKTASIHNDKGWRTLGDVGYLDEDGYLFLTDRAAHMIISGGVNIYPQEAENILAGHPSVADVAVIGVPNEEMGEEVKAVVKPMDPSAAGDELAAELLDFCRRQLASYKSPRTVDFVDDLPRDDNGKLYKRRLRDQYWAGHDSRVI